jgi:hypothetical protein
MNKLIPRFVLIFSQGIAKSAACACYSAALKIILQELHEASPETNIRLASLTSQREPREIRARARPYPSDPTKRTLNTPRTASDARKRRQLADEQADNYAARSDLERQISSG